MLKLPGADDTSEPHTTWWLLSDWSITPVPALVEEKYHEYDLKAANAKDNPLYASPVASLDQDEVFPHGAEVWRGQEERRPHSDFSCLFMEEEHVVDVRETRGQATSQEEAHKGFGWVENLECWCDRGHQAEAGTNNNPPEHGWCTAPAVEKGNRNHTTYTAEDNSQLGSAMSCLFTRITHRKRMSKLIAKLTRSGVMFHSVAWYRMPGAAPPA